MQICHFVFNFSLIQYKKLKFHLFFYQKFHKNRKILLKKYVKILLPLIIFINNILNYER